jgi:hypothetical protein
MPSPGESKFEFRRAPVSYCPIQPRYLPDAPERQEAIEFFEARANLKEYSIPAEIRAMPFPEAVDFLREHPVRREFEKLKIGWIDPVPSEKIIRDEDLRRLQWLPEIEFVKIASDTITDQGLPHLRHLTRLRNLELRLAQLTDAGLQTLATLKSLRILELYHSPNVTPSAFKQLCASLPNLFRYWPEDEKGMEMYFRASKPIVSEQKPAENV